MMNRRVRIRMTVCAVLVALVASIVTGCAVPPTAVTVSTPAPLPTYTVYPTYTPLPTYTPFPTYTPMPTVALPTATPSPTPTPTPTPTPIMYEVKVGDTATLIARRFGVTLEALLSANNIPNPNVVELGQQLVIPISVTATLTGTGTLTGTPAVSLTLTVTRTFVYRPPTATPWPTRSEAASADPRSCDTGALLILHTFWNGVPEPGVKFDYHSQPYNPNNDPSKFRFSTNENGTAYFCMPPHTRLYFFFDRETGFDARLEFGEVAEKTFDVPRLDLTLSSPLGQSYKPDSPVTFTWKPYPGAAFYDLTVYGEQENFWGGTPSVVAYQARAEKNQTQLTASFSPDAVKGIYLGRSLVWIVRAYNARGTVIAKSKPASFALMP